MSKATSRVPCCHESRMKDFADEFGRSCQINRTTETSEGSECVSRHFSITHSPSLGRSLVLRFARRVDYDVDSKIVIHFSAVSRI